MKKKQLGVQLVLVSVGLLLFVLTYLYYPNLNKDKFFGKQSVKKDIKNTTNEQHTTTFESMQYKGLYDLDKPFIVESEKLIY